MENYNICLSLIEGVDNCINNLYDNMSNLYNSIINTINNKKSYNYIIIQNLLKK
jgi:hypothetical protein